jgi:hypothetical protein
MILPTQHGTGITDQEKELIDRINSAPLRPAGINPANPNTFETYSMYNNLAKGSGPTDTGRIANQQALFQRAGLMDNAARSGQVINNFGGSGARLQNAMLGANKRLTGQQGAYESTGNRLLDILRGSQDERLGAIDTLTGLQQNYANARQKAGLSAYEQDIQRYAAALAAKEALGVPVR